ncbi:MAG: FkbM family methyltransferase [Tagaea sp.]|nr:FkbM family methyltransferase [Tagaea sp.]
MSSFSAILGLSAPVDVVDVGAASDEGVDDPYRALLDGTDVRVIGFEPRADACAARNAQASGNRRYLPWFVGDGTARDFHLCANPLTSSLYPPDAALLDLFHNMPLPVVGRERVLTRRLDDIPEIEGCDLLKLDVQGAELDVLRGAPRLTANALVVDVEVGFIPIYKGQALFGDIDVELRRLGFMLHRFVAPFSRQLKPLVFGAGPFGAGSQLLYAESAIYIRAIDRLDRLSDARLLVLARILHDVYRSFDLVGMLLETHDRRSGGALLARYAAGLAAA